MKYFNRLFILMALFLFDSGAVLAANHSSGLHLQLPNKVLEIKLCDVEELQVFQTNATTASVMLRLNSNTAARFTKLTQDAVGQSVVWVWNGRVVEVEKLKAPIGNDLTVNNFTPFEADDFQRLKNTSRNKDREASN